MSKERVVTGKVIPSQQFVHADSVCQRFACHASSTAFSRSAEIPVSIFA